MESQKFQNTSIESVEMQPSAFQPESNLTLIEDKDKVTTRIDEPSVERQRIAEEEPSDRDQKTDSV